MTPPSAVSRRAVALFPALATLTVVGSSCTPREADNFWFFLYAISTLLSLPAGQLEGLIRALLGL